MIGRSVAPPRRDRFEILGNDRALVRVADAAMTVTTRTDSVGADLWTTSAQWAGSTLGRYEVVREIGRGGMGVVVEARDRRLGRSVAVKILRGATAGVFEDRRRLLREARAMARLSHPCVVPVFDVGTHGLVAYVVMELVQAPTLAAWLTEPRGHDHVMAVLRSAGQGLAAAHAVGLVHRDFKPSNVLVGADGRARVTDFGLALGVEVEGLRDATGIGTPAYMAPEQHARETATALSDQYAFCVTAWEALFGARPFAGVPLAELGARKVDGPPPLPAETDVPHELALALRRGLDPLPARRWPDMTSLLAAFGEQRRGRRRALAWMLVPACAVIAAFMPARDPCAEVVRRERDAWYEAARPNVYAALVAASGEQPASRVTQQLDDAVDAWTSAYASVCGEVEPAARDGEPRLRCLARVRRDREALIGALERTPDLARAGVLELDAAGDCLRPGDLESSVTLDDLGAIEVAMANGWSARWEGRLAEAEAMLAVAVVQARELGAHEQLARAGARLASVQDLRGDSTTALQTLREAADAAAIARSDSALAEVYVEQIWIETATQRLADARRTARAFDVLGARTELPAHLAAARWINVAALETAESRYEEAEHALTMAAAIWNGVLEQQPRRTVALANIDHDFAAIASLQGRFDEALVHLEHQRDRLVDEFGDDYPELASIWLDLAFTYHDLGRIEDAEMAATLGRAAVVANSGPRSLDVARAEHALAYVAYERDDLRGAIEHLETAAALRIERLGPDDVAAWSHRANVARVLLDLGDHERAHALARRVKIALGDLMPPPMDAIAAAVTAAEIAAVAGHRSIALTDLADTLELMRWVEDPGADYYARVREDVARVYDELGEPAKAAAVRDAS
jgi:tetratricopeptide (TPR) repeat protein